MNALLNVGHRGAAAYAPENTAASFDMAIKCRADMIEFDLRRIADGNIVLFHDRYFRLQSGDRKAVSKARFAEMERYAARNNFKIATFEEILRRYGQMIPMNIEIKIGGLEREIVSLVRRFPPAFSPTISSFYPWILNRIRHIDDDIRTALIVGQNGINLLAKPMLGKLIASLDISAVHLQNSIISKSLLTSLRRARIAIAVWTVDKPEEMKKMIRLGVDNIITNKPDLLYDVCLEMTRGEKPLLIQTNRSIGRFVYSSRG
jgi:glycerophosphoryl diester phosphodiesterase